MNKKLHILSRTHFIAGLMLLLSSAMHAQYHLKENYNWTFGLYSRLNFNTTPPALDTSGVNYLYANFFMTLGTWNNAAVSDTSGEYLFCTNGDKIWNAQHTEMANSDNLTGLNGYNAFAGYISPSTETWQGSQISPVLHDSANNKQYYVFSLTSNLMGGAGQVMGPVGMAGRLYYSIVDMTLNGGLGGVIPSKKSVLVDSNLVPSGVIGIAGCGKYWIMAHHRDSNSFKAYPVTENGIGSPVTSVSGVNKNGYGYINFSISPDGKKLAVASRRFTAANLQTQGGRYIEIYDFDQSSGIVSNAITIDTSAFITSVCFSPNSSKLYAIGYTNGNATREVYQYNLSAGNTAAAINGSKVTLQSAAGYGDGIKLGPDNKIYLLRYDAESSNIMSGINLPDSTGLACNFKDTMILSSESFMGLAGTPMFCNDFVKPYKFETTVTITACSYSIGEETYTESGTYTKTIENAVGCDSIITLVLTVPALDPVITVNGFILGTVSPYATYQWMLNNMVIPGATNATYTVTQNGNYTVKVTNSEGCTDTSAIYTVTNSTSIKDHVLAGQILVYPNPTSDALEFKSPVAINVTLNSIEGRQIAAYKKATRISLKHLPAGIYFLKIYDKNDGVIKIEKVIKQ